MRQYSSGLRDQSRQHLMLPGATACRRKFLQFFPEGFRDINYLAWERNYKWEAHQRWETALNRPEMEALLRRGEYMEIAKRAVQIEARTHLLFSFEKMALRDAVRRPAGARLFATGLHDFLFGLEPLPERFERWCKAIEALPRRQSRVLTWPVVTICGFLAQPERYVYLKPMVCKVAARNYGYPFAYRPRPNWNTYADFLKFVRLVRRDLSDMRPRDMIDLQSFLWVQGSEEYD